MLFSLVQVGYGDILPVTHDERVTNCIAALIGGIVFAFCLGILQQLKFRSSKMQIHFKGRTHCSLAYSRGFSTY